MLDKRVVKFGGNCLSVDSQNQHQESYCNVANEEGKQSRCRAVGILVAAIGGAVLVISLLALLVVFLRRRYRSRRTFKQNIISKVEQDNIPTGVSSEVLANASKSYSIVK
jgi:hypothetical protein